MPTNKGTFPFAERLAFNNSRIKGMQCSDLSSTISGILVLQYVLEMRNTTSLGLDGRIASETPYSSFSLSHAPVNNSGSWGVKASIQKHSSAGQ